MDSPNPVDGEQSVDPAPRPTRRTFTAQYRDRILDEYLAAPHGEKGAVLRREGLYQSQMREWAQAREAAGATRKHRKAVPANAANDSAAAREVAQLTRDNARLTKQLLADGGGAGDHGKTARSLGVDLREAGHAAATDQAMTVAYDDLRAAGVPVRGACALIGRARATHYRHRRAPVEGPARPRKAPENGQALTDTERAQVLALINQPKYADLAICQIWARELDEGNYLCSTSSMYRVAKAAGQTRERRRQATHPAKVKPELLADGPSQVWTWDITKLRGPAKGLWYHLYVIIDIFSRYNPSWLLSATESGEEAEEFIEEAVSRNGAVPHTIHADRGTSMTSGSVSELLANLGVTRSHSRPRTSNDNPYSEAQLPGGSAGNPPVLPGGRKSLTDRDHHPVPARWRAVW